MAVVFLEGYCQLCVQPVSDVPAPMQAYFLALRCYGLVEENDDALISCMTRRAKYKLPIIGSFSSGTLCNILLSSSISEAS